MPRYLHDISQCLFMCILMTFWMAPFCCGLSYLWLVPANLYLSWKIQDNRFVDPIRLVHRPKDEDFSFSSWSFVCCMYTMQVTQTLEFEFQGLFLLVTCQFLVLSIFNIKWDESIIIKKKCWLSYLGLYSNHISKIIIFNFDLIGFQRIDFNDGIIS